MPLLRTVQARGENLVIVCDKELLGRKFKGSGLQIEVKESFYGGREASVEECMEALRGATIANLVGSIVEKAVAAGMISRDNVIKIQDVLHAQLVRF